MSGVPESAGSLADRPGRRLDRQAQTGIDVASPTMTNTLFSGARARRRGVVAGAVGALLAGALYVSTGVSNAAETAAQAQTQAQTQALAANVVTEVLGTVTFVPAVGGSGRASGVINVMVATGSALTAPIQVRIQFPFG